MNIDYFEEVKKGLPLRNVPSDFKTTSVCKMAISLDPTAIEYVPIKLLTEVAEGEELINEIRRRRQAQLEGEAILLAGISGEIINTDFDYDAYIEEGMKMLEEKLNEYNEYKNASRTR